VRVWNNAPADMPLDAYLGQPAVMAALYANHAWGSTAGAVSDALNDDLFKPILDKMPVLLETYQVRAYLNECVFCHSIRFKPVSMIYAGAIADLNLDGWNVIFLSTHD
jgi:hypothetical protein